MQRFSANSGVSSKASARRRMRFSIPVGRRAVVRLTGSRCLLSSTKTVRSTRNRKLRPSAIKNSRTIYLRFPRGLQRYRCLTGSHGSLVFAGRSHSLPGRDLFNPAMPGRGGAAGHRPIHSRIHRQIRSWDASGHRNASRQRAAECLEAPGRLQAPGRMVSRGPRTPPGSGMVSSATPVACGAYVLYRLTDIRWRTL